MSVPDDPKRFGGSASAQPRRATVPLISVVEAVRLPLGMHDAKVGIEALVDKVPHLVVAPDVSGGTTASEEVIAMGKGPPLGLIDAAIGVRALVGAVTRAVEALGARNEVGGARDGEEEIHEDHDAEDLLLVEVMHAWNRLGPLPSTESGAIQEPRMVPSVTAVCVEVSRGLGLIQWLRERLLRGSLLNISCSQV